MPNTTQAPPDVDFGPNTSISPMTLALRCQASLRSFVDEVLNIVM
jgi:hypothetical protein